MNQDKKRQPIRFTVEQIRQQIEEMNKPAEAKADVK